MRDRSPGLVAIGAGLLILLGPGEARSQAVGFAPSVGALPDGVQMGVTPAVSADRRYVRLSVGVGFQAVNGFSTFPVPAAVSGGGGGGGGGIGGGIMLPGGLAGMNGPMNGLNGPGAAPAGSYAASPFAGSFAAFVDGPAPASAPVPARRARSTRRPARPAATAPKSAERPASPR